MSLPCIPCNWMSVGDDGLPGGIVFVSIFDNSIGSGPRSWRESFLVLTAASGSFDIVRAKIQEQLGIPPDQQQYELSFWGQVRRPTLRKFSLDQNDYAIPISQWFIGPELRPGWRIDCKVCSVVVVVVVMLLPLLVNKKTKRNNKINTTNTIARFGTLDRFVEG